MDNKTWAEAIANDESTSGEFKVAFERYKFDEYGSLWNTGDEFFDCLHSFLKSEHKTTWSENE